MTLEELLKQLLGPYGLVIALLFILFAGYKGWWVWGTYAKELKDQNTRLQKRIDVLTGQVSHSTLLAENSTNKLLELHKVQEESET